ncbi:MAG TPA: peptide chain release factor 2 [Clostridiaceae bacterium]
MKYEEKIKEVDALDSNLIYIRGSLDLDRIELRAEELHNIMEDPSLWKDLERAQEITLEEKLIKDKISTYNSLDIRVRDVKELIELNLDESEETLENDIITEIDSILNTMDNFKIKLLLSGQYDKDNAIVTLHSGAGGTDAQDWTQMLLRMYTRWCEKKGFDVKMLDYLDGEEAGIKSVTVKVSGEFAYGFLKAEKGIHRLVRISPFNANGKRQTSFAAIEVLPELTPEQDIEIRSEDIRVDTFRASGAGGQYVNKTESAIRITHLATGIVVQCQNERSQHSNKETALKMLKAKLITLMEIAHKEKIEDLAGELKDNAWGSQIRSYVFQPYTMVKDHRTGCESGNVGAVMDGDIDLFITEYLKQSKNGTIDDPMLEE